MGRGAPATENEGNIRFRSLIKWYLPLYLATKQRTDKDRLARRVVATVRSRTGRFLRRIETPAEAKQLPLSQYQGVWLFVEEKLIIPKVKQTFRDQHAAPSTPRWARNASSGATAFGGGPPTSFGTETTPPLTTLPPPTRLPLPMNFPGRFTTTPGLQQALAHQLLLQSSRAKLRQVLISSGYAEGKIPVRPKPKDVGLSGGLGLLACVAEQSAIGTTQEKSAGSSTKTPPGLSQETGLDRHTVPRKRPVLNRQTRL